MFDREEVERLEAREREYAQTPDKEERLDLVMKPEDDEALVPPCGSRLDPPKN